MARNVYYSILAGCIFLFLAVITLSDYNIMWDARGRFMRGQSFVNFFLHGKLSKENPPITKDYARYYRDYAGRDNTNRDISELVSQDPFYRRSIYQDQVNLGFFDRLIKGGILGHPPLSDIGSAFFNSIFYEKLGWLRDDHAYAFYSVVLASILVGVFFYWISSLYGFFPALISTIALTTTPLFWAEAHNNIKDIPELAFFSLTIWAFWNGIAKFSRKWILGSAIFAGLALGTKFNIVFLPFIILPWFILHFLRSSTIERKKYIDWWWFIFIYPLIMLGILYVGWPQLWQNPISSLLNVVDYYKEIGTNIDYTPAFRSFFGFNTYSSIWIFFSTYPAIIILALTGIVGWVINFKKTKDILPFLFLFWLIVPIARTSLPNSAIYGGARQIMEYIPALSFFAGYGAYQVVKLLTARLAKRLYFLQIGIIVIFIPFIITLVKLHPAENVYFNNLIGGLEGAKKANLTGWGNTDGGIYHKAVVWLNSNAEKNSHIATAFSEPADFYIPELRYDLLADNQFSGFLQKGEYIIALTHDTGLEHTYKMRYPETFLDPVYVYKADNVPLIKIWKNEKKYLKKEFAGSKNENLNIIPQKINGNLEWNLKGDNKVISVEIAYEEDDLCKDLISGYFQISQDHEDWEILPETYPGGILSFLGDQPKDNKLVAPIAGLFASYISFVAEPKDSCIFNIKNSKVIVLE